MAPAAPLRFPAWATPQIPKSSAMGEHNRASRDALLCSLAGCIAPHLHVSVLLGVRIDGSLRLWRLLTGEQYGGPADPLTRLQREQLVLALRALDGHLAC